MSDLTGEPIAPEAAAPIEQSNDDFDLDEFLNGTPEPEPEDVLGLDDLFPPENASEKVDTPGADIPPEPKPAEPAAPPKDEKPADYYKSQKEVDEAFSKRLAAERKKIESEVAQQLGVPVDQAREIILEHQAREYMTAHPSVTDSDVAKDIIRGKQSPAAPPQEQQPPAAFDQTAWAAKMQEQELMIQALDPGFSIEKAKDNPAFKDAILRGGYAIDGYRAMRNAEKTDAAKIAAAKQAAEAETIEKIRTSNASAMTDTSGNRGGSRTARDLTDDQLREINDRVKRGDYVRTW